MSKIVFNAFLSRSQTQENKKALITSLSIQSVLYQRNEDNSFPFIMGRFWKKDNRLFGSFFD